MLTATLDGLVARFGLQGKQLGEVVAGAVLKHSRDFNLTRESVLGSKLSATTPAYDVQQACGTGLEAAILVANKIALGQIESGIAGGVDTTSDAPLAVGDDLRRVLISLNNAKTLQDRLKALARIRPGQLVPEIPRNAEPRTGLAMGDHAAITAKEWEIGREEQDELDRPLAPEHGRRLRPRLLRRPGDAVPRPDPRPEPAARLDGREARRRSSRSSARATGTPR